jgi:hypothetical protein
LSSTSHSLDVVVGKDARRQSAPNGSSWEAGAGVRCEQGLFC